MRNKFKPYIRRMKKSDLKHLKHGGRAAVLMSMYWNSYKEGKRPVPYVMVQKKNRGKFVMLCGRNKRDMLRGILMIAAGKSNFNDWANIMKKDAQEYNTHKR